MGSIVGAALALGHPGAATEGPWIIVLTHAEGTWAIVTNPERSFFSIANAKGSRLLVPDSEDTWFAVSNPEDPLALSIPGEQGSDDDHEDGE